MSTKLKTPPSLQLKIVNRAPGDLKISGRRLRKHGQKQLAQIEASIRQFGFVNPLLLGPGGEVVAGHGRLEAAKAIGLEHVPTIELEHMTAEERRAYAIADNRLAELSQWDEALVSLEIQELHALELEFDLEVTGFVEADLDRLIDGVSEDEEDEPLAPTQVAVTRLGDVWRFGDHRLVCGDARDPAAYEALMQGEDARMIFTDPPFNLKIDGFCTGRGGPTHREFVQGAGEMSPEAFSALLEDSLRQAGARAMDGAIVYACMDWRHIAELITAGRSVFTELKNVCVWAKTNVGTGGFYRSQHEMVAVFKKGKAKHLNTFGLGKSGRFRSNVWSYPGVNGFGRHRSEALDHHPTQKPVALVADAIKDVSRRGDIVLDPFAGSGTTAMAAERTRRRARMIELDPLYCDVICRRWEAATGKAAKLESGESFSEVASTRLTKEGVE